MVNVAVYWKGFNIANKPENLSENVRFHVGKKIRYVLLATLVTYCSTRGVLTA